MDPAERESERKQEMRKQQIERLMNAKMMMMAKMEDLKKAKQMQKMKEGQKKQQSRLAKVEEERIQKLKIIKQLKQKKHRQEELWRIEKQKEELRIKEEDELMKKEYQSSQMQTADIQQAAEGRRRGNPILSLQKKKKQEQGDCFASSQEEEDLNIQKIDIQKQAWLNRKRQYQIMKKAFNGLQNVVSQKRRNYFEKKQKESINNPLINKIKLSMDKFDLMSQKLQLEKEKQLQVQNRSLQALYRQTERNELKEQARAQEKRKRLLMKQIREQLLEEQRKNQSLEGVKKEEKQQKNANIPELLLCPITQIPMKSPMILTSCGHTFQEAAIRAWLRKNNKCPLCYKLADVTNLLKNFALAAICMAHH